MATIEGYRSAINSVLRAAGHTDVLSDHRLSSLIRAFGVERPVTRKLFPDWDLSVVLRALRDAPYEPLCSASLEVLTQKTVFLLALASGRRRGELAALSVEARHLRFTRNYSSVTLLPVPSFRSKTQRPSEFSLPIVIPSLTPLVEGQVSKLLCPVRALRCYLSATASPAIRKGRTQLFIPFRPTPVLTSGTMLSSWICAVVQRAYATGLDAAGEPCRAIRAHEVRALSTSWAIANRVPLDDVLRAASWRSHTTFTASYLRDLCHQTDDLYSLGPLVVSQTVVRPPDSDDDASCG